MFTVKQEHGVTLTEVLIATVLVGVVFMGVLSVDFATRRIQQTTSRSSYVINEGNALMLDILENAAMAVGTTTDVGISIIGSDPNQTLCLRQDRLETPANYTDDTWVCYQRNDTNKTIRKCEITSPNTCNFSGTIVSNNITDFSPRLIFDSNENVQEFVLQISITTLYDPGQTVDPITNPEHTVSSEISPSGHSHFGSLDLS